MKRLYVFLFLFLVCSPIFAAPNLTQWCFNEESKFEARTIQWKYCIFLTEGSKNSDVIYHFHGLGRENIETGGWSAISGHYGLAVRELWAKANFDPPTVVSISFGELWLLAEKNSSAVSGLYDFLVSIVIPKIEKNINSNIGLIGKRHLIGESMGGFNVSQMVIKKPSLFTKAAMICPAIANLSPFATEPQIAAYIARTGANVDRVDGMILMSRYFFPTPEDWMKHSPLDLAKEKLGVDSPQLYVSCGDKDEYGFQEGASLFAQIGIEKNINVTWVPISGGLHCSVDPTSVARFFSN